MLTFQELIFRLNEFWAQQGCVILQPWDQEVGAGTFHPATFLGVLGPQPTHVAYVQASRRPVDGRYGDNPNRAQHYYQYQVLIKPSPDQIQELYLDSLRYLGIDLAVQEVRFVEDNWESPALGAWGIGWEVWLNGMEVTQFTYFQQAGGVKVSPTAVELTYGLERLAMHLQAVQNMYDLIWSNQPRVTYGQLFRRYEREMSVFNFERSDQQQLDAQFTAWYQSCVQLAEQQLVYPAYEAAIKCSHLFNLLDARGALSVNQRQRLMLQVRELTWLIAKSYLASASGVEDPDSSNKSGADSVSCVSSVSHQRAQTDSNSNGNNGNKIDEPSPTTAPLLLEIGTGELPPDQLANIAQQLAHNLQAELQRARLIVSELDTQHNNNNNSADDKIDRPDVEIFYTPRRIAVRLKAVATAQPSQQQLVRGPSMQIALDAQQQPTLAARKFAASCGVAVEELTWVQDQKGTGYLAAQKKSAGQPALTLLPALINRAVQAIKCKRGMYWGQEQGPFVRPVKWVLALLGRQVIPVTLFGRAADRVSYGHPFHHPASIDIPQPSEYEQRLMQIGQVMVVPQQRQQRIVEQLQQVAGVVVDDALLTQITNLVEWPTVLVCHFDLRFLQMPEEIIITTLRHHQRSFVVRDLALSPAPLTNQFVIVSNLQSVDPQQIIRGNEVVVAARLADAEYFYQQDLKTPLADYLPRLQDRLFFHQLGSLYDKSLRNETLASVLSYMLGADETVCRTAARYAKCDLASQVVGEFPELQGVMGGCYAQAEQLPSEVVQAIKEHYLPRFAEDQLPQSLAGCVVAIADRLDTLVGLFSIGQQPTGEKDPLALRRSAIAIIRIILAHSLSLDLYELIMQAISNYPYLHHDLQQEEAVATALQRFLLERLQAFYSTSANAQPINPKMVKAALAARYLQQGLHLLKLHQLVLAVATFLHSQAAQSLLNTYKRVHNLLQKSQLELSVGNIDNSLFTDPAEQQLLDTVRRVQAAVWQQIAKSDFVAALQQLLDLSDPLAEFLSQVRVVDSAAPQVTENRLHLLHEVQQLMLSVVDFSYLISGERGLS